MNYEKLNDSELNFEVARHSFDAGWLDRHYSKDGMVPDYCNNLSDAWPIVMQNNVTLFSPNDTHDDSLWMAKIDEFHFFNENPLRAAMIVFLMMKDAEK